MNNSLAVKPNKKFSIGGILCIVCGLAIGFLAISDLLRTCINVLTYVEYYRQLFGINLDTVSFENIFDIIFNSSISPIITNYVKTLVSGIFHCAVGLAEALSFVIFGIMLSAKKHSRALLFFPIVQLLIVLIKLISIGGNTISLAISNFIENFVYMSFSNILWMVYNLLFSSGLYNLLAVLVTALGYALLFILILNNCKKTRVSNGNGKLAPFKLLVPSAIAGGSVLGLINVIIQSVVLLIMILMGNLHLTGALSFLLQRLFASSIASLMQLVAELVAGVARYGIMAALLAVTFFLVTSWIIKPFKKEAPERD